MVLTYFEPLSINYAWPYTSEQVDAVLSKVTKADQANKVLEHVVLMITWVFFL